MTGLTEQQRAAIEALLGGAKAATDDLLLSVAEQIRDRREHDHQSAGPDWDWYCLNASGWLGDKAPTVLRRLLDTEARVAELEQLLAAAVESPLAWTEQLDAKSLDNFLISLGQATDYEPMNGAISYIHELLASFRVAAAARAGERS